MKSILDSLPGLSMPVSDVTKMVSTMWESNVADGGVSVSDYRASQMNLVLHFGLKTTAKEAVERFEIAIQFAQRYPCRIIVLCPETDADCSQPLNGKLFTQCFVGSNLREQCCCEALMLGYPLETSDLLAHQVSLWLDADLPVYHWLHRVPAERIERFYMSYIKRCRRILFDRGIEGEALDAVDWPEPYRVKDLSAARTLPIRQNVGQFLSAFSPEELIQDLRRVEIGCCDHYCGEGFNLAQWMERSLNNCRNPKKEAVPFQVAVEPLETSNTNTLEINWRYKSQRKYLSWDFNARSHTGHLECDFGHGRLHQPIHIEALSSAQSLAEGLFF